MRNKSARNLLASFLIALAFGCSYKTLSIFFDGVPKPEEKQKAAAAQEGQKTASVRIAQVSHAPFAEKACDACHDRQKANRLVAPKEQLCFNCHDFDLNKAYIHGPLASGDCLLCHDPHSSRFPHLLVSEALGFCLKCHDPQSLPSDEAHTSGLTQCTVCHDAHMSDKKFLLK